MSLLHTETLRTLAAPILWSAYIAIPTRGWDRLDGVPIGPLEAAALALVWWAWAAARRHLPAARIMAVLAVAKIALVGAFLDRGFTARYYANDGWTVPVERSIEFHRTPFTRRDERLAFGASHGVDLPLYFFNDNRFNFYQSTEPERDRLPYSAEWTGHFRADNGPSDATFYVDTGPGISAELFVDGSAVIASDRATSQSGAVTLRDGWHALTLRVRAPYGGSRDIEAGRIIDRVRHPFDGSLMLLEQAGAWRLALDAALRWVTRSVDVVVLSSLALLVILRVRGAWRERGVGRLIWLAALIEALMFARGYADRMVVLGGGGDMLTYESLARTIAFGDVMLRAPGGAAGQGAPFYYQPFYPYFVALTHLVFGDSLFGVVLVQRVLLVATIAWVAMMTKRLFGTHAAWIALAGGGVFWYAKAGKWTEVLLAEPLFTPLLVACTALLVKLAMENERSPSRVAVAGVLGGIATLTRSTLLIGWPPVLLLWWASLRARRARVLAVFVVALIAVVGTATLRNWVVAKRFVPVSTSFGINLQLGNEPTRPLTPAPPGRRLLYERFGVESTTRTVIEFALQAPGDFIDGLRRKALYTVGFFAWSRLPGGIGTSWLYVGMWVLAIAGVIRLVRGSPPNPSPIVWLPAATALSHFAAVVLVFPHGYTDRLILPLYPLLIPYAAFAVEPLATKSLRLPASLAVALTRARPNAASWARWVRVRVGPIGVSLLRERRNWLYLAYSAGAIHWLEWRPEQSDRTGLLTALLLPSTVLIVASLTRKELVHRVTGGSLFATALILVAERGSLSAKAVHDPLFWGLVATVALAVSAVIGRWPIAALAAAMLAGACAAAATLLPLFPGFASNFPDLDPVVIRTSLAALADDFGILTALCLLGVWIQAIVPSGTREMGTARIVAGVRGALLTALILALAGALTRMATIQWIVALAVLMGLAEANARRGCYDDGACRATGNMAARD